MWFKRLCMRASASVACMRGRNNNKKNNSGRNNNNSREQKETLTVPERSRAPCTQFSSSSLRYKIRYVCLIWSNEIKKQQQRKESFNLHALSRSRLLKWERNSFSLAPTAAWSSDYNKFAKKKLLCEKIPPTKQHSTSTIHNKISLCLRFFFGCCVPRDVCRGNLLPSAPLPW